MSKELTEQEFQNELLRKKLDRVVSISSTRPPSAETEEYGKGWDEAMRRIAAALTK